MTHIPHDPTEWALDRSGMRQRERSYVRSRQKIGLSAAVQIDLAEVIRCEAASRAVSVSEIVKRILEVVADDDLFAAILDR